MEIGKLEKLTKLITCYFLVFLFLQSSIVYSESGRLSSFIHLGYDLNANSINTVLGEIEIQTFGKEKIFNYGLLAMFVQVDNLSDYFGLKSGFRLGLLGVDNNYLIPFVEIGGIKSIHKINSNNDSLDFLFSIGVKLLDYDRFKLEVKYQTTKQYTSSIVSIGYAFTNEVFAGSF